MKKVLNKINKLLNKALDSEETSAKESINILYEISALLEIHIAKTEKKEKTAETKKNKLINKLKKISGEIPCYKWDYYANKLLIQYINDKDIKEAYNSINK